MAQHLRVIGSKEIFARGAQSCQIRPKCIFNACDPKLLTKKLATLNPIYGGTPLAAAPPPLPLSLSRSVSPSLLNSWASQIQSSPELARATSGLERTRAQLRCRLYQLRPIRVRVDCGRFRALPHPPSATTTTTAAAAFSAHTATAAAAALDTRTRGRTCN